MTDNTVAAQLTEKLFGAAGADNARLQRTALRMLAAGEPITVDQLAAAAEVNIADLERAPDGGDIEYDEQGRIIGWGLTHCPTPHKFTVNGHQLYTWCAPDTLVFPAVIGAIAQVESRCPATGDTIRLTIDPDEGVTSLDPASAVVSIVDPGRLDPHAVRTTGCNLQHFFVSAHAATDYQSRHPGMVVLSVADAYQQLARPIAEAMLRGDDMTGCC